MFLVTVFLCLFLLIVSAFLPQDRIVQNMKESAVMISAEGEEPVCWDYMNASQLDTLSEMLILMHSCETKASDISSVLTNPRIAISTPYSDSLFAYEQEDSPEIATHYIRYWMGFRPIVRLLLTVFNYWQIRRYLTITVYILFVMVICSIAKWADTKSAFLFALSVIMVRLNIVSQLLQFSWCFLLAFCAMLMIPWLSKRRQYEGLFFMELGMLTMYLDFYTTPIITFGLPIIYLNILRVEKKECLSWKQTAKDAALWLTGYGCMWLSKLVLTTVFTDINGIRDGLLSFSQRVGIQKVESLLEYYDVIGALKKVVLVFSGWPDKSGIKVVAAVFGLTILFAVVRFIRSHKPLKAFKDHSLFLFVAILPITWFIVAAQPTYIHAYFQYRGIVVTLWGCMVYAMFTIQKRDREHETDIPFAES